MDMDKAKRSFNIEKGYKDVGGVGVGKWLKFCVCALGLWKIGEVKGRAYNLARTKGLITWVGLALFTDRDPGTLVKRNISQLLLQLYYNWASPVSWDPGIVLPGSRVEIFQVITFAGRPANEPSEKQDSE